MMISQQMELVISSWEHRRIGFSLSDLLAPKSNDRAISSVARPKKGEEEKKDFVYFSKKKGKCLKALMNLPNLEKKYIGGKKAWTI